MGTTVVRVIEISCPVENTEEATMAGKAAAVAKTLKKGISKKGTRIHTRVHFYKPKTFKAPRKPKYVSKSTPRKSGLDKHAIIKYPLTTESSMKLIEDSN